MKRLPYLVALICTLSTPALYAAHSGSAALDEAYIAGFLAGAQVTDSEIIHRLDNVNPDEKYSDFFNRATRPGLAAMTLFLQHPMPDFVYPTTPPITKS